MRIEDFMKLGYLPQLYKVVDGSIPTIETVIYDSIQLNPLQLIFNSVSTVKNTTITFNVNVSEFNPISGDYFLNIEDAEIKLKELLEECHSKIKKQISDKEVDLKIIEGKINQLLFDKSNEIISHKKA